MLLIQRLGKYTFRAEVTRNQFHFGYSGSFHRIQTQTTTETGKSGLNARKRIYKQKTHHIPAINGELRRTKVDPTNAGWKPERSTAGWRPKSESTLIGTAKATSRRSEAVRRRGLVTDPSCSRSLAPSSGKLKGLRQNRTSQDLLDCSPDYGGRIVQLGPDKDNRDYHSVTQHVTLSSVSTKCFREALSSKSRQPRSNSGTRAC